jgi:hypothetical protein
MVMTYEQIVDCDIPEGIYQYPLQLLRDRVASITLTQEACNSCAVAFSALFLLSESGLSQEDFEILMKAKMDKN